MLIEFINHWNPFNIYGKEVGIEDLIYDPLQKSETLMQDSLGHCRRIKVPALHSPLWERGLFWLQTHLNQKGHLEAIDNLIALFYQKLLQFPPQEAETLQEINLQISKLKSLKNDYRFGELKASDSAFIDLRLEEIEQRAYSIFAYYYKLRVVEEEECRRKAFLLFQEQIEQRLHTLALEHQEGLLKARFLMMFPSEMLQELFIERIRSLYDRMQLVKELHRQIQEMEKLHEGKFTVFNLNSCLERIKMKLSHEVCKLGVEIEVLISSLVLNYRLAPFQGEVKALLDAMEVNPDLQEEKSYGDVFQDELENEIKRIEGIFNHHVKKE